MFLAATSTSYISLIALVVVLIVVIGLILKKIQQPYIISYILVGAIIGEDPEADAEYWTLSIINSDDTET